MANRSFERGDGIRDPLKAVASSMYRPILFSVRTPVMYNHFRASNNLALGLGVVVLVLALVLILSSLGGESPVSQVQPPRP